MTAATPNDSGAAASRDAARTARRLTDGTLPRRVAPPGPGPGPTPAEGVAPPPAPVAATAVSVRPGTHPVPTAAAPPLPAEPAAAAAPTDPLQAPREAGAPSARPPAEAGPARTAPGAPAPAGPPTEPRPSTPATDPPPAGAGPAPAPAPTVTGPPTPNPHEATGRPHPSAAAGPSSAAAGSSPTPASSSSAVAGPSPAPASSSSVLAGPSPAPAGPSSALAGPPPTPAGAGSAPAGPSPAPAGPGSAPAPAPTGRPPHEARPAQSVAATSVSAGPPGEPHPPVAMTAATAPAGAGPAPAARVLRGEARPAPAAAGTRAAAPATAPESRPAPGGPARAAEAEAPHPGARAAGRGTAPTAASAPAPTTRGGVFKEERDVLDFGRITGARVASVAVPVAAVGRLPRRKNVIGAETTGSIPVHLLFRDGGAADTPTSATAPAPAPAPGAGADDDDGGPDTVAMPAPAPARGAKAVIPRPVTKQVPVRPASARPAPTADPALVERAAAVLPGWVGVVGGLLALAGCAAVVWWAGAVPAELARMLRLPPRPYHGIHLAQWGLLALGVLALLFAVGGLGRGRVGYAWVLTLFGEYRGTVRRTGLVWASPLLLRRRVDVRLRHWRSEPLPAVDAKGTALDVTVLVVWRVRDTVRAALGVDGHEDYLREQVEAAMARVLSQLPADAFHEDAPTLRDAEAVGEALTRLLSAECAPVGLDVFSAQPTRIEYAPEVAEAMRRRRIAAIDAKHRDSVLTSVVDAVDDVVHRLTSRGLVELDDYERKALVKDLTVAFYTGRGVQGEGA
ncbi:SPFH domain-containing protein [Streptomyces sp. NPDC085460]|uniref:SPFH domain-containing protein n=1 Tax=Streptomyces sp. NPDC085460 TaxID=3365723 RepID=UPI0037CE2CA1